MDITPLTIKCQFVLMYWEYIIIVWRSVKDHLNHILTFLFLHLRAGILLKWKKWVLIEDEIEYLKHIVQPATFGFRPNRAIRYGDYSILPIWLESSLFRVFATYIESVYWTSQTIELQTGKGPAIPLWTTGRLWNGGAGSSLTTLVVTTDILTIKRLNDSHTLDMDGCNK